MMADGHPILYDPASWVVGDVLLRQACDRGDKPCLITTGGEHLTFYEADQVGNQFARFLQSMQVGKGDAVAVLLPNGLPYCCAWFGISRAGAVHVAVNTEFRGVFLSHVLNNCQARILITEPGALGALLEIEDSLTSLTTVVVSSHTEEPDFKRLSVLSFDEYRNFSSAAVAVEVSYRDLACIMYTSGTTGPSKGVLMPHAHTYLFGLGTIDNMRLRAHDTFYVVLPLFHANGMFMQVYASLIAGCTAVIRHRFSASSWIHDIARYQATITNSLGVVSAFILDQPANAADRRHCLHTIGVAPNPPELEAGLRERFGIRNVVGLYGMTEINIPLYTVPGVPRPGSCGKLWDRYYELKIVDPDTDEERPRNAVGEIVVRSRQPFGFMAGYNGMPQQTVEAWRNFWFHTGDAALMDDDGYVYFVDRIKDCIRRRGENVSSFEIEQVIAQHDDVAEVAAVAAPSEIPGGEDEIMVVVVLDEGRALSPAALLQYCEPKLPRFALPRYVEFVDVLPKTPTNKVQKHRLRKAGITPDTWDREAGDH